MKIKKQLSNIKQYIEQLEQERDYLDARCAELEMPCLHVQGNFVIEQLREENTRLREQLRWRDVSENPEYSDYFLVKREADINGTRGLVNSILPYSDLWGWNNSSVVKWLPLPQPPSEEE